MASIHDDWHSADLNDKQQAALELITALHTPEELTSDDFQALSAAGVADREIDQVVQISAAFHIISRIADALDFEIPTDSQLRRGGRLMLKRGYRH